MRFYLGTYTGPQSKGIYICELDATTGAVTGKELAAEIANPSFLALSPDSRFLYCVNEIGSFEGRKAGAVSALAVSEDGSLKLLNQQASEGTGPCYVSLDPAGRFAFAANYNSGSVAMFPILKTGLLAPAASRQQHEGKGATRRQEGPHAHSIRVDPGGRFAIAADLGLDRLFVYRIDGGTLQPHSTAALAAGAGPRHTAFHPDGKSLYVINELNGTLTGFAWDSAAGRLSERQTLATLPEGFGGSNLGAEVQVHPNGRFLYCSNRGHDSITIFSVVPESGRLQVVSHESTRGQHPRHFSLTPDGSMLLVANKDSNNLVSFRVDAGSGRLTCLLTTEAASPVCIRFVPPALRARP
jgi:6-phosphogluconolactonase